MLWTEFINQQLDFKEIENIYDKSHIAVELVRWYKPKILDNIATIANLSSGAYGIYNSGENKKILPPDKTQKLIYFGKIDQNQLNNLPAMTIRQYYPEIRPDEIKSSDTIHVNVNRIIREKPTEFQRIFEIASTIVHEATHEIERETKGSTSETSAIAAETDFANWVKQNIQKIMTKYPEVISDH